MGEFWKGAGKGHKNIVYMNLSTGIGAGIMIDEKLYEGANKFAGEIAYMVLGNRHDEYPGLEYTPLGALEWVVSGIRIIEKAKSIDPKYNLIEKIFEDYNKVYEITELINKVSEYLAKAVVNIVSILDPEVIIVGGIVGKFLNILLSKMQPVIEYYLPIPVKLYLLLYIQKQ